MERGYIIIKENEANQLIIEAKIVNYDLWMTQHEIADLFNVLVSSVGNTILALFKSGMLKEENVTQIQQYEVNGRTNEMLLYNLEAITHIGFRTSSIEAKTFRDWITGGFVNYLKMEKLQSSDVLTVLNGNLKIPFITSLN